MSITGQEKREARSALTEAREAVRNAEQAFRSGGSNYLALSAAREALHQARLRAEACGVSP